MAGVEAPRGAWLSSFIGRRVYYRRRVPPVAGEKKTARIAPGRLRLRDLQVDQNWYFSVSTADQRDVTRDGGVPMESYTE